MSSARRCPRCGYVLRYIGMDYSCDFCGLRGRRSITNILSSIERSLRSKVAGFLEPRTFTTYYQAYTQFGVCAFCGGNIADGSITCPSCGRIQAENLIDQDRRVLEYIEAHGGTISISQAETDLAITSELLAASIERLKSTGVLKQE